MAEIDDEEFDDFLGKIDDVNALIQGLKDGTVDPKALDKKDEKIRKEQEAKEARREAKKREAEAKAAAAAAEVKRREQLREDNKEKLEELKQNLSLIHI